jgi:hypothetical protein
MSPAATFMAFAWLTADPGCHFHGLCLVIPGLHMHPDYDFLLKFFSISVQQQVQKLG